jgi:hypothetical protein
VPVNRNIWQSTQLAESSAHIDPAVSQQSTAYRVGAFECAGLLKNLTASNLMMPYATLCQLPTLLHLAVNGCKSSVVR